MSATENKLVLRPLQEMAVDAVSAAFRAGHKNVMLQAPCGFGKTELATAMLMAVDANYKTGAFICDRIALIEQTAERFDKYGLSYGVHQAQHYRYRPWERIQLCSIQTLNRREWPKASLLMCDEAHLLHKSMRDKLALRECYAVGLSGSPVTKGLAKYFDVVVNAATTNQLIRDGLLCDYSVFAPSAPDMTGVHIRNGEYDEKETEERVMPIVGDCVAEYLKRGDDKKFIGFGRSVAHVQELQKQFMAAGINVALYTYREGDEQRKQTVDEFRKPDSYIRGLLSVDALTRGFDVADVEVLILARPIATALHLLIQMVGRVLRPYPGKGKALILDHSGAMVKFWGELQDFFENGCNVLDDGKPKEKKKAETKEKEPMKCPQCFQVHAPLPACPACGFEYPRKKVQEHVVGTLVELNQTAAAGRDEKQQIWSELRFVARERGYNPGWAAHKYKDKFGVWPRGLDDAEIEPSQKTMNWIRSQQIRYAKRRPLTAEEMKA
jgi:DNA repair protein RadD